MKNILTVLLLFASLSLMGQASKIPYGDVALQDTTAGTASTATFVMPQIINGVWEAFYVISPDVEGLDSIYATAYLYEAVDVAASAYVAVDNKSVAVIGNSTRADAKALYDTVSGVKQELLITETKDSSACIYTIYAWYRPLKNDPNLQTVRHATASQTLTDANTITFTMPHKLASRYNTQYIVKVTKASGTVAGTIYLDEAADVAGSAWANRFSRTLSDASANYRFNTTNQGVRQRIRIVGSGTQSATVIVYAVFKPV